MNDLEAAELDARSLKGQKGLTRVVRALGYSISGLLAAFRGEAAGHRLQPFQPRWFLLILGFAACRIKQPALPGDVVHRILAQREGAGGSLRAPLYLLLELAVLLFFLGLVGCGFLRFGAALLFRFAGGKVGFGVGV